MAGSIPMRVGNFAEFGSTYAHLIFSTPLVPVFDYRIYRVWARAGDDSDSDATVQVLVNSVPVTAEVSVMGNEYVNIPINRDPYGFPFTGKINDTITTTGGEVVIAYGYLTDNWRWKDFNPANGIPNGANGNGNGNGDNGNENGNGNGNGNGTIPITTVSGGDVIDVGEK